MAPGHGQALPVTKMLSAFTTVITPGSQLLVMSQKRSLCSTTGPQEKSFSELATTNNHAWLLALFRSQFSI